MNPVIETGATKIRTVPVFYALLVDGMPPEQLAWQSQRPAIETASPGHPRVRRNATFNAKDAGSIHLE